MSCGTTWKKPICLLDETCDHEPAKIFSTSNGYTLWYSCDENQVGQSYMAGKIYYAKFDKKFNLLEKDKLVNTKNSNGLLLYDVLDKDSIIYFLCAEDYLTDSNMVVFEKNK